MCTLNEVYLCELFQIGDLFFHSIDREMQYDETHSRRKERRFKTCPGQVLECATVVNEQDVNAGTVIDISPSGLRLLCEGRFQVDQTFSTELKTDRSHGTYRGVIRRVEPWVGGQSILGCQLIDKIPNEVLGTLAMDGIVNRRRDHRVPWNEPAKMSWELHSGEIDIEIHDCSVGGLKISTSYGRIPDDVCLRIRVDGPDDLPMIIDARTVWQVEEKNRVFAGLAFTTREVPDVVAHVLAQQQSTEFEIAEPARTPRRRNGLAVAVIIVLGIALWQTGLWG